jgi:hypothetical protein
LLIGGGDLGPKLGLGIRDAWNKGREVLEDDEDDEGDEDDEDDEEGSAKAFRWKCCRFG